MVSAQCSADGDRAAVIVDRTAVRSLVIAEGGSGRGQRCIGSADINGAAVAGGLAAGYRDIGQGQRSPFRIRQVEGRPVVRGIGGSFHRQIAQRQFHAGYRKRRMGQRSSVDRHYLIVS